ncbi:MAG TPA: hypothetical protein VM737_03160 [Gemmatimonadota bacterium]|nr:hypothetical protein [Gemmatimonadota bacterium]
MMKGIVSKRRSSRVASSLALIGFTLGSLALPCFAAGLHAVEAPIASEQPAPPMGCDAPKGADRGMLCAAPGTNAPLGVAAAEIPAPDVLLGMPAMDLPELSARAISAPYHSHGHPPPRADLPAFLLHAAFLI